MPLYLKHQGMANASIGFWMAVLVSAPAFWGNGQWDVWRTNLVAAGVTRTGIRCILGEAIAMLTRAAMARSVILGAAGFTLYPVAMARACEKSNTTSL